MAKKKDYHPKEPGQQYEEIIEAQRFKGRGAIGSIGKSKDRDEEELERLAEEALERLREKESLGLG